MISCSVQLISKRCHAMLFTAPLEPEKENGMSNNENRPVRTPPAGMPAQPPRPDRNALRGKPVKPTPMPQQMPVTDEETTEKKPSLAWRIFRRAGLVLLLTLALVFAYIFLLLGEPEDDAKYEQKTAQETITMPMGALDIPGQSDPARLAESFFITKEDEPRHTLLLAFMIFWTFLRKRQRLSLKSIRKYFRQLKK